jgi:hypothetical protein
MADDGDIRVEVVGIEKVQAGLKRFPLEVSRYLQAAGLEAAKNVIFSEQGMKRYPPETSANQAPAPYYVRGRGMVRLRGGVEVNDYKSERFGTQWYATPKGAYGTEIGNRAGYARYLAGEEQARWAGARGWRKLVEVVDEKMDAIRAVYQGWVDKLIKELEL